MKRYAVSLAVALTLFSTVAWGQQGSSELRGLVTDPQDAVLPGVTVTVRNQDTGMFRETISNPDRKSVV